MPGEAVEDEVDGREEAAAEEGTFSGVDDLEVAASIVGTPPSALGLSGFEPSSRTTSVSAAGTGLGGGASSTDGAGEGGRG